MSGMQGERDLQLRTNSVARTACGAAMVVLAALLAVPAGAQTVYFDPSANYPTDYTFTAEIHIATAGQAVKGVELKVAYDPFLLHLDGIAPGTWLTGAPVPYYFFDYTGVEPVGTLRLAAALLGGDSAADGLLAVCQFTAATFGTSPLIFQDLDVRAPDNTRLDFAPSVGDFITLDPVIPQEDHAFGTIKALFR